MINVTDEESALVGVLEIPEPRILMKQNVRLIGLNGRKTWKMRYRRSKKTKYGALYYVPQDETLSVKNGSLKLKEIDSDKSND
ncbi:hypothetical protein K3495_g5713 [Podosphaera aphanis]|nr:hypothetical protein K3495_g5713 [Podosphaera aphanis]